MTSAYEHRKTKRHNQFINVTLNENTHVVV